MRFAILALAVGAAASVIPGSSSPDACLRAHSSLLASLSACGSPAALSACFSQLSSSSSTDALEACYIAADCSADDAAREARHVLARCDQLEAESELRRRQETFTAVITPAPNPLAMVAARTNVQGDDCFTTEVQNQKVCPGVVSGTSMPCSQAPVTSKSCRSGWLCTEDPNGKDICMAKIDKLDIGGIIIAIVFSVIIVAGISFLIFMSCAESRAQKKMNARAEATALARAATKKKRADEVRAPLMAQQQQTEYQTQGSGSGNPFGDSQPH
ncbi:hypothetical protein A9K55_001478 [Cordyceps militaris]|uniref:Extracellular membrane protein CFEM domain-containing protein n=1 Tax=Cordyceps militaris TaxID=73501 RepID=A0A2H4SRF7_CORMI|nr:hypothetical protein A9K55_001478 [Cordyceps militaris]